MPRNKTGGKKHKKGKGASMYKGERKLEDIQRDVLCGEVYAEVTKCLGCRRFNVRFLDESNNLEREMVATLKGSCKKMVRSASVVLVTVFEFNENQGQIIDVYSDSEVRALKKTKTWNLRITDDEEQAEELVIGSEDEAELPREDDGFEGDEGDDIDCI